MLKIFPAAAITPEIAAPLARLLLALWSGDKDETAMTTHILATAPTLADWQVAVVYDQSQIVGAAYGVTRVIKHQTTGAVEKILALLGIGVYPEYRGRGYGRLVTQAQLNRVDRGEYPLALWQTAVPEFYEKLGAAVITNRFVNSLNPAAPDANPFWDKCQMVYPSAAWRDDEEIIDLLGPGY